MKTKYCIFILLIMALSMPLTAYSQCADMFKEGVALMSQKKYKTAKTYFKDAKECDPRLAKQCDEKIRECDKLINPKPISSPSLSHVMTIDKNELSFGAESTAPQTVKVQSSMEWVCSSDADWCEVVKNGDKLLSISCQVNKSAEERTTTVQLSNGKDTKYVKVVQEGLSHVLDIIDNVIEFGKDGTNNYEIKLNCNVDYEVLYQPEWVEKLYQNRDVIVIRVKGLGRLVKERKDYFEILSLDGSIKDHVLIKQSKIDGNAGSKTEKTKQKNDKKGKRGKGALSGN